MSNQLSNYQQKYAEWLFWYKQSIEYKLKHPEPPKPKEEPKNGK